MGTGEFNAGGSPAMDLNQGGVERLLVASCYGNRDNSCLMGYLARMQTSPSSQAYITAVCLSE